MLLTSSMGGSASRASEIEAGGAAELDSEGGGGVWESEGEEKGRRAAPRKGTAAEGESFVRGGGGRRCRARRWARRRS